MTLFTDFMGLLTPPTGVTHFRIAWLIRYFIILSIFTHFFLVYLLITLKLRILLVVTILQMFLILKRL